jgi:hypothetical protein
MVGDVVGFSVGHANPERRERLRVHALFEFQCRNHGLNLPFPVSGSRAICSISAFSH